MLAVIRQKLDRTNNPERSQKRVLSRRSFSRKAKGEKFQHEVAETLLKAGKSYGLKYYDFRCNHVSANGLDVLLNDRAQWLYGDIRIEAKHQEKLVVASAFQKHVERQDGGLPILVHKRAGAKPMATLWFDDLVTLLLATSNVVPREQGPNDDADEAQGAPTQSPATPTPSPLDEAIEDFKRKVIEGF
jgi:hypothetical protein